MDPILSTPEFKVKGHSYEGFPILLDGLWCKPKKSILLGATELV